MLLLTIWSYSQQPASYYRAWAFKTIIRGLWWAHFSNPTPTEIFPPTGPAGRFLVSPPNPKHLLLNLSPLRGGVGGKKRRAILFKTMPKVISTGGTN